MLTAHEPLTFLERDPDTGNLSLCSYDSLEQGAALCSQVPASFESTSKKGGTVLVLGAGVAGLTATYELLKQNLCRDKDDQFQVFLLEATGRVGGRSLTLRPGDPNNPTPRDSFTEEITLKNGTKEVVTQTLTFEREPDDPYEPYLNAGPGRIPSGHIEVLKLCQELGVEMEVYIMETRSNLVVTKEGLSNNKEELPAKNECLPEKKGINRQIVNDIRGHIAQQLYDQLKDKQFPEASPEAKTHTNLLNLLIDFGALTRDDDPPHRYRYVGSQRAGYSKLPGLADRGTLLRPISLEQLADAQLWKRRLYQAEDFLWQTTSFQPVGGMDKIEQALAQRIRALGQSSQWNYDPILLNCPVTSIRKGSDGWTVQYTDQREGSDLSKTLSGDFCVVNIPLPLLSRLVQEEDFEPNYWTALNRVMQTPGFFRPTCKVGWQAERKLWQQPATKNDVPIYGGVSRIDHPMTQMWYPSDNFHAKLGTLTGAYNYEQDAEDWGKMLPEDRLKQARKGAECLHGKEFAKQLKHGISIAWQNIPTQRGGWTDWSRVASTPKEQAQIMNTVRLGSQNFHVIGDQVSFIPGWKEGAVLSALEVFAKVTKVKDYTLPMISRVPDTRAMVEGYQYCPETT